MFSLAAMGANAISSALKGRSLDSDASSAAATLAEATNALMIPPRARDQDWNPYVKKLADAANKAYRAAEAHDLKSVSEASDHGICAARHCNHGLE
jgi:hypothetical protein